MRSTLTSPSPLSLTQAAVRGVESTPLSPSWSVCATAICADPLPGRVDVVATAAPSSVDKFAIATCPANTMLVASGADILSGKTGRTWQARASAVCATPLPGLVRQFTTSGPSSAKTQVATRPAARAPC